MGTNPAAVPLSEIVLMVYRFGVSYTELNAEMA